MKPIIGVLGRIEKTVDDLNTTCIWEAIRKSILRKGGIPILLLSPKKISYPQESEAKLTKKEREDIREALSLCDGLLLQGGTTWYLFDELYYQEALALNMPILGICLGMQMMAKVDCGIKGLEDENLSRIQTGLNHCQKNQQYVHSVFLKENTLLTTLVDKTKIKVNSRHSYHVSKVKNLVVSAISEDGIIEAIENPNKSFVLGVAWHPEDMLDYDKSANRILEGFIEAAKKYQNKK